MEEKFAALGAEKNDLAQEKDCIRAELIKTEQEKMDLCNEKQGLDQSLHLTQQSREQLEQDLMLLHREKAELTDNLSQVRQQNYYCMNWPLSIPSKLNQLYVTKYKTSELHS